jgi:hypothetical protein
MESQNTKTNQWIEQIDLLDRVGQELREVYMHAGVALSAAQILEHVLKSFIVPAAAIQETDDVGRALGDLDKFGAEFSKHKHTLGQLIGLAKSCVLLGETQELEANLAQSLKDRNSLVHHFFWHNAIALQNSDGRRRMTEELARIQAQFGRTIKDFKDANKTVQESLEITQEDIDRAIAAAERGALEEDIITTLRELRERALRRQAMF